MGDEPKYDPDRMAFEDLDLNDIDAVEAWLDDPNTQALHDDLARAFRALPAEQQLPELRRFLRSTEEWLQRFLEGYEQQPSPEGRRQIARLIEHSHLTLAQGWRRLQELEGE